MLEQIHVAPAARTPVFGAPHHFFDDLAWLFMDPVERLFFYPYVDRDAVFPLPSCRTCSPASSRSPAPSSAPPPAASPTPAATMRSTSTSTGRRRGTPLLPTQSGRAASRAAAASRRRRGTPPPTKGRAPCVSRRRHRRCLCSTEERNPAADEGRAHCISRRRRCLRKERDPCGGEEERGGREGDDEAGQDETWALLFF